MLLASVLTLLMLSCSWLEPRKLVKTVLESAVPDRWESKVPAFGTMILCVSEVFSI